MQNRPDRPTPPPNITRCSQCGQDKCPGHPVFACLVLAVVILGLVVVMAAATVGLK